MSELRKTGCQIDSHKCVGCNAEEFPELQVVFRQSPAHIGMRFQEFSSFKHHYVEVDGVVYGHVFESLLGENGWILRYLSHDFSEQGNSSDARAVHACRRNPCIERVTGHVKMVLKPERGRWLSVMEESLGMIERFSNRTFPFHDGEDHYAQMVADRKEGWNARVTSKHVELFDKN
jgi:hypothetical protein